MNKYLLFTLVSLLCGCGGKFASVRELERPPYIFPDYRDVTIPVNMAPLNFVLREPCEKLNVHFVWQGEILLKCRGRRKIDIPAGAWRKMLQRRAGSSLQAFVYVRREGRWHVYRPFDIHVSTDSIDPYIAYRLIEPGYEPWDQMGIYQRNLSNFDESAIIVNRLTRRNCVNCHSFHNYNPDKMMFHARGEEFAGTFLLSEGLQQRINTKTAHAGSAGTYPAWHPSGDYIAFSSNTTRQIFFALPGKKIEVYDLESDLVVWDVKQGTMLRDARFTTQAAWETFPAWSPDGQWLYFCSAGEKDLPAESKQLKYGLFRVPFDAATGRFGARIEPLLNPETTGKSYSFPRLSPDGRYLLYTSSSYATFPIWHRNADLEMIDLHDNTPVDIGRINSNEAESYHAWSSNGRWILFSSRRADGLYTRLFFAHFDASGEVGKPFLLPQKNPDEDVRLLKSYNLPEFIKGRVTLNPYEISRTLAGDPVNLKEIIPEN